MYKTVSTNLSHFLITVCVNAPQILSVAPNDGFSLVHLGFIMKTADLDYAGE